jgi:heme A synthase
LATATTVLVYTQILIGATMRHTGAGLAIPDFPLMFGGIVPDMTFLSAMARLTTRNTDGLIGAVDAAFFEELVDEGSFTVVDVSDDGDVTDVLVHSA